MERMYPKPGPPWEPVGRPPLLPHQQPPPGRWDLWLLMAGRGAGKTEACARYFAKWMREHPGHRGRIIAPTFGDAVSSCIEGPSGLQSVDPGVRWLPSAPGGAKVSWPNGSEALVLGTPTPREVERLRAAGNRHIDWWEEMAANPQLEKGWGQAEFGLRLGDWPHTIASTTPRTKKKLKELLAKSTTVITRATIHDNPHLLESRRAQLVAEYQGTRIGRQELLGELLDDIEGALWTYEMTDRARRECPTPDAMPDMARIVVAVDPAVTSGEDSDETGIMVVGQGSDGNLYVLDDRSALVSPDAWVRRAIRAFEDWDADRIIGEANNGGDLIEALLRTVRKDVPYQKITASRGKAIRAEPVSALYEIPENGEERHPRVYHTDDFPQLVDQLTNWTPLDRDSPDRLDALVWGVSYLMGWDKPRVNVHSTLPADTPPVVRKGDLVLVGEKYIDADLSGNGHG